MVGSDELLSTFDVDHIATEALLFQTGYLTITDAEELGGKRLYQLGLSQPGSATKPQPRACCATWCRTRRGRWPTASSSTGCWKPTTSPGSETLFHAFFASIPYEWYTNNDIAGYEGYYASVFYSYFAALGLDITVEDSSSHGRLDMAVLFNGHVYLFEFKVVELASAGAALAQLQERQICG